MPFRGLVRWSVKCLLLKLSIKFKSSIHVNKVRWPMVLGTWRQKDPSSLLVSQTG